MKTPGSRIGPKQPSYGTHPGLTPLSGETGAQGDADFSELKNEGSVAVAQIIDPLRLRLQNGKIVQLAGLEVPDLDPYEPGELSLAARDRLDDLLKNKQVRLYVTRDPQRGRTNRLGHELVQIARSDDGLWIQGDLLSAGLARVRPSERNPEMAMQMIAREDKARAEGKGLWAEGGQAVLTPVTAKDHIGEWTTVEGTVRSAATANNTVYLNFGADWRTDFTVSLSSAVRREMLKDGVNPLNLGGRNIRVRGWMESYNGPLIKLMHPAWMEISDEAPDPARGSGMMKRIQAAPVTAEPIP